MAGEIMNLETNFYSKQFLATHIVRREGNELMSETADIPQDTPWKTAILGRVWQWAKNETNSPDAVNGIFHDKLMTAVNVTYRRESLDDLQSLKGRLTHLIENAKTYEEFKKTIFSEAYVNPAGLGSLDPLIAQAEERLKQIEAQIAAPKSKDEKNSPLQTQLQKLHENLGIALTQIFKKSPKELEGLFRIEGEGPKVTEHARQFIELDPATLNEELKKENSPHNIAKAMTRAIRESKPLLIDSDAYPFFIAADKAATPEEKIKILKAAMRMLPSENQAVLKMLFTNLREFSKLQADTKMNPTNLAIVWGPNLLQSPPAKILDDMNAVNNLTKFMIENDVF